MNPTCLYCSKNLQKQTFRMIVNKGERPSIYHDPMPTCDVFNGRAIKAITKVKLLALDPDGEIVVCWLGDYKGYGSIDGVTAFCSLRCGTRFGLAAAQSGYRITALIKKITETSQNV